SGGVRGKRLRQRTWLLLLCSFDLFEEIDHRLRIVPAGIQILGSEIVGLSFESAGELHKRERDANTGSLIRRITDSTAYKDEWNGGKIGPICTGHLSHGMAGTYVGNFMGHDAGQLGFVVGGENGPCIDVEEASRKRKGIDLVVVDHLNCERDLGVRMADQVLADAIDVLIYYRIAT